MSIFSDIIDIIRHNGILKGGSIILRRIYLRGRHSVCLILDIIQAFWKYRSFYKQGRKSDRRLICISMIEHMGDIVASQPVARLARTEEPDALIVWCVKRNYVDMVSQFTEIDSVITVRCLTSWIVLRKWGRFDRVIDLHINGRTCLTCGIPLRKEEGDQRVTMDNYYNHGSLLQVFCLSAGLPLLHDNQPDLPIANQVKQEVNKFCLSGPTVVIHCCSNESCRDWNALYWNELIDALHGKFGVTIVEIGVRSPLSRQDSLGYRNLCGRCSILQSAELIKRSLLFIGIDSGPAHVANAVGTPGVILLGDYLGFRNYTPYTGAYADGSGATLVRSKGDASLITLDDVLKATILRLGAALADPKPSFLEKEK